MSEFSIIGKPVAMIDSAGKTTGAGKYTDDLSLPGMLIGKILHSPYPHARIKRIDASRALAIPGVIAVVTGKDAPTTYGILPIGHDEHALALDKVRYVGDNVACIAALDESTAEKALQLTRYVPGLSGGRLTHISVASAPPTVVWSSATCRPCEASTPIVLTPVTRGSLNHKWTWDGDV